MKLNKKRPPARTPQEQENQMVALAMDQAEEELRNKTASSQVVVHFLKIASSKERLEREILAEQKKLITAKTDAIHSGKRMEEVYKDALKAMSIYTGATREEEEDD